MNWLRWQPGRLDTGYDKLLLARTPRRFDAYLLRYHEGSSVPQHMDPVEGFRHYRLNVVLREAEQGGKFYCNAPIWTTKRIKFFRSDHEHAVWPIEKGSRLVLSIGLLRKNK